MPSSVGPRSLRCSAIRYPGIRRRRLRGVDLSQPSYNTEIHHLVSPKMFPQNKAWQWYLVPRKRFNLHNHLQILRFVPRKRFKWDKMLVMMDPKVRSVYSYCLTAMRRYLFVIRAARRGARRPFDRAVRPTDLVLREVIYSSGGARLGTYRRLSARSSGQCWTI